MYMKMKHFHEMRKIKKVFIKFDISRLNIFICFL